MGNSFIFILGGARSGKSSYAEQLAKQRQKPVCYVATAQPFDNEMRQRIQQHKAERPLHWQTIEAPLNIGQTIGHQLPQNGVVLVDCLTVLTSNIILQLAEPTVDTAQPLVEAELNSLYQTYKASQADWIVVSNEVGLGIVPAYPLGRTYRDVLGRVNQRVASWATQVIFMVAGLPLYIKGGDRPYE